VTSEDVGAQRAALGAHFKARTEALIDAWRAAIAADPKLTTNESLPRAQLVDHLPLWLETFADALITPPPRPTAAGGAGASAEETRNAEAHGLQRWQQGYDLHEVTREWAALHRCLVDELERYFAANAGAAPPVQAEARATLALYIGEATGESAAQFFHLERLEAAGAVRDLEEALEGVREIEQRRAELWQQAAHDLRGNLGVVSNVAQGLARGTLPAERQQDFLGMLHTNVGALHRLLDDVTDLARLHAGQEQRRVASFDAADLLRRLCEDVRPLADEKKLFLKATGVPALPVEGDAIKVRRIVQNLLLNALKYTLSGGVTVSWGDTPQRDDGRWWLLVEDTGPGFHAGPGAPLVSALGATAGAPPAPDDPRPVHQQQGEGLGLAIVKRLCELLGASLELDTVPERGTRIRVLLPRHYAAKSLSR
jgi:signal transduction histidine kinase